MAKKPWQVKRLAPKNIPQIKLVLFSSSLNLATIATVILLQSRLPPEVPLFYGLAEGQEQLAASIYLLVPPIISLGIIFVNTILSSIIKNNLLKSFLIATATASSFFSTTTIAKIIFLVGSF